MRFKLKPDKPKDNKHLRYLLKEVDTAVRIMCRDKKPLHLFDVGRVPDGTKYVCLIFIAPEENVMRLAQGIDPRNTPDAMVESEPLDTRTEQSSSG